MISRPLSSVRLSLSPSRHLSASSPLLASHLGAPCRSLDQTSHHDVAGKRRMSSCQRVSPPFIPRPIPTNSSCHSNAFPTRMVLQTTRASITRPCTANIHKIHSRHFSSSSKSSLRKLIRPFLLACHPDAMSNNNNNNNDTDDDTSAPSKKRTSQTAKQVNLQAVQTLNGLIDTCDEWIHRCCGTTTSTAAAAPPPLPELYERYTIEFLLPGPTSTTDRGDDLRVKPRRRGKRHGGGEWTMRSIVLEFPRELRDRVRPWARGQNHHHHHHEEMGNGEASRAGRTLKRHVERELRRLLIVAGLEYEGVSQEEGWWTMSYDNDDDEGERNSLRSRKKGREEWTLSDHFLYELGIEPTADLSSSSHEQESGKSSAFYGRDASAVGGGGGRRSKKYDAPPPTYSHVHAQREAFLKSIRWDKFRNMYEEAWEDAQADFATSRMNLFNVNTREGRERRERLVSMICGRVRIWTGGSGESHDEGKEEEDIPEGLDVVQQLVAIRRLSSILYDNFDYLRMEKMGRMWENLVIVLTPPRIGRRRRQALVPQESGEDGGSLPDGIVDVVQRKRSPHPGRKLNKWERRMKRRERTVPPSRGIMRRVAESHFHSLNNTQDNYSNQSHDTASDHNQSTEYTSPAQTYQPRFKFSYGTQSEQGTGQVTAYIPIDFKDEELVQKLHTYLYDYFDNACSTAGFLRVGPDGEVTANVDGVEDYDEEEEDGMKAAN